jgi:uncharacterized protein
MTNREKLRTSSYFNTVDVADGSSLVYNGLTSRVDLVPSDVARMLADSGGWRTFSFLLPEEKQHLLGRGHLTELTVVSEREQFRRLAERISTANEGMNRRKDGKRAIAFILTYKCNLSCTYCYQHELREVADVPPMDEAFVDEFLRSYVKRLFPGCTRKNISLLLFGGEPLLPGNRCAIERILAYSKKHGSMVSTATNGVLLPGMMDLVGREAGTIRSIQVTLDGDEILHDKKRIPPSGAPTFDTIIGSVRELMKMKVPATIRIHLHPDGIESTRALVDYLDRHGILGHEYVNVYFDPISSFDAGDVSPAYRERFRSVFEGVALKQGNPPSSFARNFSQIIDPFTAKGVFRTRYCAVGTDMLRVVDGRGDVYDCYEEAGNRSRRIAKLSEGDVTYFKLRDTHRKRHILNMPECLRCSIALYCGGGCMSQAHQQKGSIFRPSCLQTRAFVDDTLRAYYLLNRTEKQNRRGADLADDQALPPSSLSSSVVLP